LTPKDVYLFTLFYHLYDPISFLPLVFAACNTRQERILTGLRLLSSSYNTFDHQERINAKIIGREKGSGRIFWYVHDLEDPITYPIPGRDSAFSVLAAFGPVGSGLDLVASVPLRWRRQTRFGRGHGLFGIVSIAMALVYW
jgi:hypothetical protein